MLRPYEVADYESGFTKSDLVSEETQDEKTRFFRANTIKPQVWLRNAPTDEALFFSLKLFARLAPVGAYGNHLLTALNL
jgi:hypothetical protein